MERLAFALWRAQRGTAYTLPLPPSLPLLLSLSLPLLLEESSIHPFAVGLNFYAELVALTTDGLVPTDSSNMSDYFSSSFSCCLYDSWSALEESWTFRERERGSGEGEISVPVLNTKSV